MICGLYDIVVILSGGEFSVSMPRNAAAAAACN